MSNGKRLRLNTRFRMSLLFTSRRLGIGCTNLSKLVVSPQWLYSKVLIKLGVLKMFFVGVTTCILSGTRKSHIVR